MTFLWLVQQEPGDAGNGQENGEHAGNKGQDPIRRGTIPRRLRRDLVDALPLDQNHQRPAARAVARLGIDELITAETRLDRAIIASFGGSAARAQGVREGHHLPAGQAGLDAFVGQGDSSF